MKKCLIEELIPKVIAYNSVICYRKFIDTKKLGNISPKYKDDYKVSEPTSNESEFVKEIRFLQQHEVSSKEWIYKDPRTKVVTSHREFILEELVPAESKAKYQKYMDEAATKMYDIRQDVRI